ncbi:hypothetical protein BDW74DRAFT_162875 [Aspergillus multicolor]|uniref:zinc metalloprotease n=1 Tax=Aspergillus multicolor TaxID=41759 RepID=UPI003CCDF6CE
MRLLPILLTASAGLASARCGTRNPSERVHAQHKYFLEKEDREAARLASARDVFSATIDTYVHVVTSNTTAGINTTTLPSQIHKQIDVLNENYASTGFQFNLVNVSYTHNDHWTAIMDGSTTEYEVKSTLRRGDYTALNLYFGTIGSGILGYATFPDTVTPREFLLDGVVCDPQSLPGGKAPYNLGITAVHETGHWLNLFHTFQPGNDDPAQPGCYGHGDYIHDTPAEAYAAFGCPASRDTCKGAVEANNTLSVPGPDPIHNFMDYTDDRCLTTFSAGQIMRMQNSWREERVGYVPAGMRRRSPVGVLPDLKAEIGLQGKIARPGSGW